MYETETGGEEPLLRWKSSHGCYVFSYQTFSSRHTISISEQALCFFKILEYTFIYMNWLFWVIKERMNGKFEIILKLIMMLPPKLSGVACLVLEWTTSKLLPAGNVEIAEQQTTPTSLYEHTQYVNCSYLQRLTPDIGEFTVTQERSHSPLQKRLTWLLFLTCYRSLKWRCNVCDFACLCRARLCLIYSDRNRRGEQPNRWKLQQTLANHCSTTTQQQTCEFQLLLFTQAYARSLISITCEATIPLSHLFPDLHNTSVRSQVSVFYPTFTLTFIPKIHINFVFYQAYCIVTNDKGQHMKYSVRTWRNFSQYIFFNWLE